jgi:hypothetical protein
MIALEFTITGLTGTSYGTAEAVVGYFQSAIYSNGLEITSASVIPIVSDTTTQITEGSVF